MIELTFLGHAAFQIADENYRIVIDPFLTDNPAATTKPDSLDVDAVLVTHGHADHLGDAISIATRCGAPIIGVNDKVPLYLAGDKLANVKAVNAQALITVCPFCHMMFDINQPRIERLLGEQFGIPVLHYPQLLGLAMGLSPKELALEELRVDATKILSTI